jgi:Tol biopolymer transport system component
MTRLLPLYAAGVTVGCLLLCVAGILSGSPSPQLAYTREIGALHLIDPHFRHTVRLVDHLDDIPISFNWSPDGSHLAFTLLNAGQYDLYVLHLENREYHLAHSGLPSGRAPAWSPDSTALVFVSETLCIYQLSSMSLSCPELPDVSSPVWSPDGDFLTYADQRGIYVNDRGGDAPRLLKTLPGVVEYLSWSRDGSMLAFVLPRLRQGVWVRDLMLLSAADSSVHNLTESTFSEASGLSWSPADTRLAYNAQRNGRFDIYLYDLAAATEINLTDTIAYEGSPQWSPDGQRIAYVSDRNGLPAVYIQEAQPEAPVFLSAAVSYSVAWRPVR